MQVNTSSFRRRGERSGIGSDHRRVRRIDRSDWGRTPISPSRRVQIQPSLWPSQGEEFDYSVSFDVTLLDSGGVGGDLISAAAQVLESSDGVIIVSDEDPAFQVNLSTSTTRWEANGSVTLAYEILYRLPGRGSEAIIDVTIIVVDDAGLSLEATDRIDVSSSGWQPSARRDATSLLLQYAGCVSQWSRRRLRH